MMKRYIVLASTLAVFIVTCIFQIPAAEAATGCTTGNYSVAVDASGYTIATFTTSDERTNASCSFVVPSFVTSLTALIVAGGGGGGSFNFAGGGGAGGIVLVDSFTVTPGTTFSLSVGRGGAGGTTLPASDSYTSFGESARSGHGKPGQDSSFATFTAKGGGGGGGCVGGAGFTTGTQLNGGSGGGAAGTATPGGSGGCGQSNGTAGIQTQPGGSALTNNGYDSATVKTFGNPGGSGAWYYTSSAQQPSPGGGGGAGGAGENGSSASTSTNALFKPNTTGGPGRTFSQFNGVTLGGGGGIFGGTGGGGSAGSSGSPSSGGGGGPSTTQSPVCPYYIDTAIKACSASQWNYGGGGGSGRVAIRFIANPIALDAASDDGVSSTDRITSVTSPLITLSGLSSGDSATIVASKPGSADVKCSITTQSSGVGNCRLLNLSTGDWSIGGIALISGSLINLVAISVQILPTLRVTPVAQNVIYGSSFSDSITTSGLIAPDVISSRTLSYTGSGSTVYSKSTLKPTNVGTYIIAVETVTGVSSSKYNIVYETSTLTITKKALVLIASSIAAKTYDGTRSPGSLLIGAISGLAPGDSVSVSGSVPQLGSANAGSYSLLVTYSLSNVAGGGLSSNYSLAPETLTATVNKKVLTVNASSVTVNYGSNVPTITYSYSGFLAGESATSLSQAPTCTTTYTPTSPANTTPTTSCSGAAATNYSFSYVSGTVTINALTRTLTFPTTSYAKTYGDASFTIDSATISAGSNDGSLSYTATGGVCSINSSRVVTISAAGTCSITSTISAGTNYQAATSNTVTVTIARKALSISAASIASKVYDGTRNPGTLSVGTLSGLVSGESLTVTGSAAQLSSQNADTYTVVVTYTLGNGSGGGLASNYSLASDSATAVVTKKALTVTASNASVAYGDNVPAISYSYSGFIASENATYVSQAPTCTTTYTALSAANTTPTTSCSGASATNYSFTYVSGTVTISKVTLTVTASSHSVNYGATAPTITSTITGFKNSQTASVIATLPTCTSNYTNTSPAGSYYTRCSGGSDTNYNFTYVDGAVTVSSVTRTVSLSVASNTLTYGDTTTATFSMTGNSSDGTLSLSVTSGSCSVVGSTVRATAGTGTCTVRATASGAVSYQDTYTAVTISLQKKSLTVTGTSIASRTYNGSTTPGTVTLGTLSGFVGSDSLNFSANVANYSSANVGTYSTTVIYTLISTPNGVSSNYQVSNQTISGQITAVSLTVTAPNFSRHFSQAVPSPITPVITGFVNSETSSALSVVPTCSTTYTTSSSVGSSQNTSCSGGSATNYSFTYVNGIVTVTTLVRTIEVTASRTTLIYGESTSISVTPSIGSSDGVISVTVSGGGCSFGADSTTVVATDPTQTCSVGASITGGINYNDATATAVNISLQRKTLTISGLRTQPKVYDGSILVPLTGGTLNGVINSDSVTATYSARFLDKSVGASKPVTSLSSISGAAASRYILTQPTLTSETITAATLTVSGLSAVSRPANGSRSAQIAGTPQLVGLVAGDTVTVINFSSGLFETSTAGDSITVITTMTIIGGDSANYTLTLPTLVANITVSYDNIITFAAIPNIEIGSTAIILTPTVTSGLAITLTLTGTACNLVGTTLSFVDLGSCSITASQPGNQGSGGTFPAATSVVRTFSVIARSITISADSKTFNVGGQMTPTFKVSGGLLSGDRIASVTFRYSGNGVSNSPTVPSTAGTYSIAPSLAVFSQPSRSTYYSITYTQGALVILDSTVKALTSLKVSPAGGGATDLLNGSFSNSIDSYTVRIDYSVSSVILFLERSNTTNVNAQVRINDSGWRTLKWSSITGGSTDSGLVPVPTRISSVQVRLYGNDKESDRETRIISISIYRDEASKVVPNPSDTRTAMPTFESRTAEVPLPANAAVSAISFSPTINFGFFNPNVDSYTAVVARKISAISAVTNFTGNGITVRISVNNGPYKVIPSTGASPTYALNIGSNVLVLRVSSLDGSMFTYLFTITRQSS